MTSLKGVAVEVLEHLTATQLQSYFSVVGALHHQFRCQQHPEVYRTDLKTKRWRKDKPLSLLM